MKVRQLMKTIILSISVLASLGLVSLSHAQAVDASATAEATHDPAVFLKRIVAIARFSNETASGTTFLVDKTGDRLGKHASDILSAKLASTNRFLMFERADIDDINDEKALAGITESGVPVNYLIVGSISEFGRSVESQSSVFSKAKTQKAYAKVNIRLIEVATGRIVYSEEGAGEATSTVKRTFGVGGSAAYDQSLSDKAISTAISALVSSLVENLTKQEWRSNLLSKEDGLYIIAGGASQGISGAVEFKVIQRGRTVKNPQTGGSIELPGRQVASLSIQSTYGNDSFSEVSFASLVNGSIDADLNQYYITK
jgi:curli biogenesis system outer membrane secretion channel CsgG